MVKALLLVAFVVNIIVSSTGTGSSSSKSTDYSAKCKPSATVKCKSVPACRLNEVWSKCPKTVCRPKTCNDVGFPVACPDLRPDGKCPDKPACICREGYVKNKAGICILMKLCPSCGGDRNAKSSGTGCGKNNCNRLCSNYYKKPGPCTLICPYNSCDCRPGFVFDEIKKKCVLPSQCTVCKGVNEIYDLCPAPCPPQNCSVDPAVVLCAVSPKLGDPECKPGCRCIDNFVRNYTGVCIPRDQCPKCPKSNQVYDPCIAPCPPRRCDVDERLIKCAAPPKIGDPSCVAGCRCADGYYLNNLGVCVTRAECPPICNGNEVYNECVQGYCLPKKCSQLGFSIACPRIDPKYCKKGCLCKDGYVRSNEGVCIPVNECPSCGGDPYAVSGCGNKCGNLCTDYFKNVACTRECQNINGCNCREGYVYNNSTMQCVLPKDCPPTCGADEVYNECVQGYCLPKKCSQLGFSIACPKIDPKYCKKGCLCKDGYVRSNEGVCIPVNECPSCGGDPQAVSGCGNKCGNLCTDYFKNVACTRECQINGCNCREGYVYNNNTKQCVLPKDCPPTCGADEVYNECVQGYCLPKKCSQLGFSIACPRIDPKYCKKGCLCKDGYVRSNEGVCIPVNECPSCGGDPHAVSGCGNKCGNLCTDYFKNVACTRECQNINGCNCREGYVYNNSTMQCVLPKDCPPTCGADEVYNECVQGYCLPKKCSQLGFSIACPRIDPKYCKKGCLCKDGYVRSNEGVCIPVNECPSCGGDPHAVSGCGNKCGNLCTDYFKDVACTLECQNINGCDCREGYVYNNSTKQCVLPKDCTQVCNKDEVYSECINGGCTAKNCSQIGTDIPCVKRDPKSCIKGCLCKEGYLRQGTGECVPEKDCKTKCNKPNEYYTCDNNCPPNTCESLDKVYPCPIQKGKTCKGRCKCKKGYLRNKIGDCITEEQCRKCMGPHEYFSCGGACDNVCKTLTIQNQTNCSIINIKCNEKCYCEKDYARAENNTCIPIKDCKTQCNKNEVYSECINGGCTAKNCSQIGTDIPCVKRDPKSCIKGCLCKEGYLRQDTGECVPEKDCKTKCNKPNEYYTCDNNCPPNTCESLDKVYPCPIQKGKTCKGRCKCKKGYLRNKIGDCITEEQCRKCMGPHEYFSCGGACDNVCKTLTIQNQTNCLIINKKCNEKCYCEKDYARAENNTCIPIKDCKTQCNKNEVYSECINGGCTAKNCSQIGTDIPCVKRDPKSCIKGCLCKEGYLRKDNGECVPENECGPKCNKPNEYYEPCDYNCPPNTCASLDKAYACPIREGDTCKGQCKCTLGYFRNIDGECNTEEQCRKCMGPHEYFACKGACDNVCISLKTRNQTNCPRDNVNCTEKCYCEKGYARAKNDTCIPIKDCKKRQCKKNERYEKCPAWLCQPKNCSELGYPQPCPFIPAGAKCPVKPGCVCADGYLKNCKGKCILKEDCPEICSGKNEVFENCTNPTCLPKKCSEVGYSLNCTNPPTCNKGCVCKSGYVKNCDDICIPIKQCPSCKGDENAVSGCGVNCLKKCYDLQNPNNTKPCPKYCKVNSCDCKKDYYFDENTETCVLSKECTPACNKDEVLDPCINGGCTIRNCSQIGGQTLCIDPIKCKPGCSCKKGYLRSDEGICIQIEKCPEATCCELEKFEMCPDALCKPLYCDQLGNSTRCPKDGDDCFGYPSCVCKDNYVRNDEGKCIPKNECPCGENEVYENCVNSGCEYRNCSELDGPVRCIDPIQCEGGCTCKKDYLRLDATGVCVPKKKCPTIPVNSTVALANFKRGNTLFVFKFINEMLDRSGNNFMASTLSLLIVLAQLTLYAFGASLEQLLGLFNLKSKDEIPTVFSILIESFKGQTDVVFELKNKCYANIDFPLTDSFIRDGLKIFDSESENINFGFPVQASESINDWVANSTHNLINNIVSPDMFNSQTRLVLINCLYFLGNWIYQFDKKNTKPADFYLNENDVVSLPTMFQRQKLQYAESDELDAQFARLPYKGNRYSLLICLPRTKTGLKSLMKKLDPDIFNNILNSLKLVELNFSMPVMDYSTSIPDLIDFLKKFGVTAPFEGSNDYQGIFKNNESLYISDAIQKTVFKADETGTELAAVTAVIIRATAVRENTIYTMQWNRPGAFFILSDDNILFFGVFAGTK